MVFPAPQVDGFENKGGMLYKRGQFHVGFIFVLLKHFYAIDLIKRDKIYRLFRT